MEGEIKKSYRVEFSDVTVKVRPIRHQKQQQNSAWCKVEGGVFLLLLSVFVALGSFTPLKISLNSISSDNLRYTAVSVEKQIEPSKFPINEGLGDRYILVNLQEQILKAYDQGKKVFETTILSGHKDRRTPRGEFKIINQSPRAYSQVADLYMPYWMAFTHDGKYWLGFHELPEYPDGSKEGEENLGWPYSGRCIRLGIGAAEEFYNWSKVGDKVLVY
ncbi:MAG: hypothetical protein COT91_01075 [Candidatus Doudnabacteria bacterium CG10_big_fil_rev_8_21_14_0_10_41_10]|uniref:L,D-TPase catalytic domain-containing protein n=1 Tax=Candidatus Doudnabacteria bacterium CG10_big_fil_rev_8_21_14_0_10_41_10 TaxID=1974551 RepID=A0A2H0VEE7_9BACT|nr:MAG: hypothetical protein COT91_01075 [Candidatus Doudnabacteria bacterium CG10_big_fil_rev_8_21_14_0_10_41_10]